ncbi:MAG: ABC transporter permease [Candidatus Njordarchaeum guaymaensis]
MIQMRKIEVAILLSIILYMIIFMYYPLSKVIVDAFINEHGITLEYFLILFRSSTVISAIFFSFWIAIISTIFSVILGVPLAYILTKYDFKGKDIFTALIMVPFVLPGIVVGFAFLTLYGTYGYFTQLFYFLTGHRIILGRGIPGILLAHIFYNAPMVALITTSVWRRIDPEIEESAEILGSKGFYKFIRIILPLIYPGILSAAVLTFIFCFTSFEIVLLLGGPFYRTIEVQIYSYYLTFFDFNLAAALAFLQIIFISIMVLVYLKVVENVTQIRKMGKTGVIRTKSLFKGVLNRDKVDIIMAVFLISFLVFMVSPLIAIFLSAFHDPITGRYTLQGWYSLFSTKYNTYLGAAPIVAPINSILYSIFAGTLTLILSIATAYQLWLRKRLSIIFGVTTFIPVAVSRITIGLGIISAFGPLGILATDPRPLIIIAHTFIAYPFSTRALLNGLYKLDPEILDAAKVLGASTAQRIKKIDIPLIAPSIALAVALAFATSLGEFASTTLLYRGSYATLTVLLYLMVAGRKFITAGAAALLLVFLSFVTFLIILKTGEELSSGF